MSVAPHMTVVLLKLQQFLAPRAVLSQELMPHMRMMLLPLGPI